MTSMDFEIKLVEFLQGLYNDFENNLEIDWSSKNKQYVSLIREYNEIIPTRQIYYFVFYLKITSTQGTYEYIEFRKQIEKLFSAPPGLFTPVFVINYKDMFYKYSNTEYAIAESNFTYYLETNDNQQLAICRNDTTEVIYKGQDVEQIVNTNKELSFFYHTLMIYIDDKLKYDYLGIEVLTFDI